MATQETMLLGNPEYAEQLMRALELKGDLPQSLLALYQLGFQLDDLSRPEFAWLRRTTRWSVGLQQGAVVGQFSIFAFSLSGAVGRAKLAYIERLRINNRNAAPQLVQYGVTLAGIGGVALGAVGSFRDDRQFRTVQAAATAGVGSNVAAPLGGNPPAITVPANSTVEVELAEILTGVDNGVFVSAFVVQTAAANEILNVSLDWRERSLLQTEL